ncbi:uncharacterized protein LOC133716675 [Rosa rugosa]|uniref:uncharacterized protein LOC133716675 n=1 Tax=Rosa rugosa TaxID=74645 RepID=UPI002B4051EB|nr:uncharacterized protein LOC133716675 [Rosa rugosa]
MAKTSTGGGFVVRDNRGRPLIASTRQVGNTTVPLAEALALRDGLKSAKEQGYNTIEVEGDSKLVIDAVNNVIQPPWRSIKIIHDIQAIATSFESISFKHIFKKANFVADALANLGHRHENGTMWTKRIPIEASRTLLLRPSIRAETNIKPWKNLLPSIKEGNKRTKWKDRVPYAYWKGNPNVAPTRKDLLKCNVSDQNDWNTLLYIQNWEKESKEGYKQSSLEDQCKHRYKIYVEGWAWSVSEKYILACDSMTLYVNPRYYDFYMRGMLPLEHYWPIRDNSKCTSLKFVVEWGNNHTKKAEAIGEAASNFIQEDLKMDYVYDYMFHVLNEYAKLLKFKPTIPPNASELCSETMACPATATWKKFMKESMVMSPSDEIPCSLPPPYDPQALRDFLERKANSTRQVEAWENEYWQSSNKKQQWSFSTYMCSLVRFLCVPFPS